MITIQDRHLMSTEQECLTTSSRSDRSRDDPVCRLLSAMGDLAPTLPSSSGIHNSYGRTYLDCGHIELAICESHSPYLLAMLLERQQGLLAQAVAQLKQQGTCMVVANNNHSGLLKQGCPIWGSHENFLIDRNAGQLAPLMLPFLSTRIYAGAGGILFPSGHYLAAVRPVRMELDTGGDTTDHRAIFSLSREEHHMGPHPAGRRLHLILGDGHRSQFNTALQFGATALAIKAACHDRQLPKELAKIKAHSPRTSYVRQLRKLNVLARPGEELSVDPLITRTQRVYWEAAGRYVDSRPGQPDWVANILTDWDHTLTALEQMDRTWLAARLDAFIKYEFYSSILAGEGLTWKDLPGRIELFHELALIDHSYHEFTNPDSVFRTIEQAGVLAHQLQGVATAGEEEDPFIPETYTRAQARARFIRDHAGDPRYLVDWSHVLDQQTGRIAEMHDPFARELGPWKAHPRRRRSARLIAAFL